MGVLQKGQEHIDLLLPKDPFSAILHPLWKKSNYKNENLLERK
jgi:hypothetical protein